MRIAVVDIGSNSTRLLISDVDRGAVTELDRRTQVTRLADGLERTGELSAAAIERVHAVVAGYVDAIGQARCEAAVAVMTSAVRDAVNGEAFAAEVRARHGLDANVLTGDEEARLTFLGAAAGRWAPEHGLLAVIDVGGGSTELVAGREGTVEGHVSLQLGVVRHSERHLCHDPPEDDELVALGDDVRETLSGVLPDDLRTAITAGVAVAGTPTSCAAMAMELEPYDGSAVEGFLLEAGTMEEQLARLATMSLRERRRVPGLHPDRAVTIVAGITILLEAVRALELERVTVSERDILHGAALDRASRWRP